MTIATTAATDVSVEQVRILGNISPAALRERVTECDVIIFQGLLLSKFPFLARTSKFLVCDFYDPYILEYLAHPHPTMPKAGYIRQWQTVNEQLSASDVILCANDRQRDFVFGWLAAVGRLAPEEYSHDPSFARLVKVVPFGLPAESPSSDGRALRQALPSIQADDRIAIWAGGIWDWLDPETVIRAAAELRDSKLKLVFLGSQDPNQANRPMGAYPRCLQLARDLGVLDSSVFFLNGWVSYDRRADYLCGADIGVSAHANTIEARFAFRTRVLDYIWTGLPMVLSRGDYFANWAEEHHVGIAVEPGDVSGWVGAFSRLLASDGMLGAMKQRLTEAAAQWQWQCVAQPLMEYCETPYKTARATELSRRLFPAANRAFESYRRVASMWSRRKQ